MWSPGARRPNGGEARAAVPRARRAFSTTFQLVARALVLFWAADGARVLHENPRPLLPTLQGVFAALFATLLVGLPAAGALGSLAWISVDEHGAPGPSPSVRLARWLAPRDEAERIARATSLFALPPALGVFVALTFLGGRHVVLGMARPDFAAWALVGLELAALVAAYTAFRGPLVGGLRRLVRRLDRRVRVTPGGACAALVLLALLVLGGFGYAYRKPLSYVYWDLVLSVLGAAVGSSAWTWLSPRAPRGVRALAAGLTALLVAGALASLYPWPGELYARRVAEQRSRAGVVAYGTLKLAFDVDRDGYIPLVSGGDCAPYDPSVHPGAVDIPGNHKDEDCDGSDLDPGVLPTLGTIDHPVPSEVPYRPPIVLITVDVLAAAQLGTLGAARSSLPQLDAYAQRSALFERCFVQGPSTRLSFPALFTGRWDSQIDQKPVGHHPYPLDPSEHTLAEVLREHGYDTLAVLPDPYFAASHWQGITQGFGRVVESPFAAPVPSHTGARVTDAALAELGRQRSRPLFLWVHYFDAHGPHEQPEGMPVTGKEADSVYRAELSLVDRELGRLLQGLESTLPNALVIITGDHGTAFDEPRHAKLGYGFDLSTAVLHVPLIVHAPFVTPHRVAAPVSSLDIFPTLVNLLRIRGKLELSGVSLVPELLENRAARPALVMSQFFLPERAWTDNDPLVHVGLRTERFNLVHDRAADFYELYDYRNDYFERRDLSVEPAYQDTLRTLKKQLLVLTWMAHKYTPKSAAQAPATTEAPASQPGLWQRITRFFQTRSAPAADGGATQGSLDAGPLLAPARGLDAGLSGDAGSPR
jgi:choline-sulfatase